MADVNDRREFFAGMNKDDDIPILQRGEYTDGFNIRMGSSTSQGGMGMIETLQGEVELLINASAPMYYGGAIGGEFIYSGYEEVQIGNQVWMKRNWDFNYPGSKVYNDDEANRDIYGGLYTWDMLQQVDFIPEGWRLPTEADIDELIAYLGGDAVAGGKMKEVGLEHWLTPNTGATDENGFRALPGGSYESILDPIKQKGKFWLQDELIVLAILAGTTDSSFILLSIDGGSSFENYGSMGKGNPLCFCKLENGDIIYGTNTGYWVNCFKGTSGKISDYAINAILAYTIGGVQHLSAGDSMGNYYSWQIGVSPVLMLATGHFITSIIFPSGGSNILIATYGGIFKEDGTELEFAPFLSMLDVGGGIIYAGTYNGEIYKSIDYGLTWVNIGDKGLSLRISFIIKGNSGRYLFGINGGVGVQYISYTDDNFTTTHNVPILLVGHVNCAINYSGNVIVVGTNEGNIIISTDNGLTYTPIVGNPQQGEKSINSLISFQL